jgi:hypothetical protein
MTKLITILFAAAALILAPTAGADPNQNALDHANDNAQTRGITVAGVAGDGPGAVLGAIQVFAPDAAQDGLARAQCVAAGNCPD